MRALLVALALLLTILPVASAGPDVCGAIGGCTTPTVTVDDEGACAGYGTRYGGAGACLDQDEGVCVITAGEFYYDRECYGV